MRSRHLLAALLVVLFTDTAAARVRGVKGRGLVHLSDATGYEALVLRPTTITGNGNRARPVEDAMVRAYADQFLAKRLLDFPTPVFTAPDSSRRDLLLVPHVLHQAGKGAGCRERLVLRVDLVDARTEQLVAYYSGYGSGILGPLTRSRDDLQENTRVFRRLLARSPLLRRDAALRQREAPSTRAPENGPPQPMDAAASPSPSRRDETPTSDVVFTVQGTGEYHLFDGCPRVHAPTTRRLFLSDAQEEDLSCCRRCQRAPSR
ncbi:MAG: hypothetical protein AAF533_20065 [Acidobacteriota bacterium]